FKDKNEAEFKKLVDKDIRCVYDTGVSNMTKELDAMKKWDMKSFAISDYDIFSDEKDVIVSTYTVKVEGTFDGKDMSGSYNAGDPLKLMRVMPPKEARVRCRTGVVSHAIFRAWLFCCERHKSGKQEPTKRISVLLRFLFSYFPNSTFL